MFGSLLRRASTVVGLRACQLQSAIARDQPCRALSTSLSLLALDKDAVKEKRKLLNRVSEEHFMDLKPKKAMDEFDSEEQRDLALDHGIREAGIVIPTEETLDAVFHGVPYRNLPIAHIRALGNNTIVTITDGTGKKQICNSSCGMEGFRHSKKRSNLAAQATGLSAGKKAMKKGITAVRVTVKGIGYGRMPGITGLKMAGLDIISISDRTIIHVNACKPRKVKRH